MPHNSGKSIIGTKFQWGSTGFSLIPIMLEGKKLISFADGLSIVASAKTPKDLTRKPNETIAKINTWVHGKGLKLVQEKRAVLIGAVSQRTVKTKSMINS